jgi:hypothetical protein
LQQPGLYYPAKDYFYQDRHLSLTQSRLFLNKIQIGARLISLLFNHHLYYGLQLYEMLLFVPGGGLSKKGSY